MNVSKLLGKSMLLRDGSASPEPNMSFIIKESFNPNLKSRECVCFPNPDRQLGRGRGPSPESESKGKTLTYADS